MSIKLGEGHGSFTFQMEGEGAVRRDDKGILPDRGGFTVHLEGGKWSIGAIEISGPLLSKVDGTPTKRRGTLSYSTPLEDEDPEFRAPRWLIDFVHDFEGHLNRTPPANAIKAAGQLPAASREDFDPMTLRVLRDLMPDPDSLDAVLRIFNPKIT